MGRGSYLSKYLRIQSDLEACGSLWQLRDLLREDLYGCIERGQDQHRPPWKRGTVRQCRKVVP